MFIQKKGNVKFKIDMYKDSDTDQFVGIAQGLGYSGYGKTIEEAIKNTNQSTEMALEWYAENGMFEDVLKECGYELHIEDEKPTWEPSRYIGNFDSQAVA